MRANSTAFLLYAFRLSPEVTHVSAQLATLPHHLRRRGRGGGSAPDSVHHHHPQSRIPGQRLPSRDAARFLYLSALHLHRTLYFKGKPQHAGHPSNCVEMIWYHGTSDSSVFLLLLLLFVSPFGPLKGCRFNHAPIATSDFSQDIKSLKESLLLDYKVSMPFNLKPDIFCGELWDLHFINENLKKLINVSGKKLEILFRTIYNHTKFVEACIEIDNSSASFEFRNISQFVDDIPFHLQNLSTKIEMIILEDTYADFTNCSVIQSQIESSTSPINTSEWKLEKKQSSQPTSHNRSYWWLLLPASLVCLIFGLWKVCQCSSSRAI